MEKIFNKFTKMFLLVVFIISTIFFIGGIAQTKRKDVINSPHKNEPMVINQIKWPIVYARNISANTMSLFITTFGPDSAPLSPSPKNDPISTKPYHLELKNANGDIVGNGVSGSLNTDGDQIIQLSNVAGGDRGNYINNKVYAYDEETREEIASSETFSFYGNVMAWNLPNDIIKTSATNIARTTAKVKFHILDPRAIKSVDNYYVEIHDSNGNILGEGRTCNLNTAWDHEVNLVNLDSGTHYNDNVAVVYDADAIVDSSIKPLATSDTFSFTTQSSTVKGLSDPEITDITPTTATITTTPLSAPPFLKNENEFDDFRLEVHDSNGAILGNGKTGILSEGVPTPISLTELTENTKYSGNTVVAFSEDGQDTKLATSNPFDFSTKQFTINELSNPNVENIGKTTATVKITASSTIGYLNTDVKSYDLEVHNSEGAILGDGKLEGLTSTGDQEINLTNLSLKTTYSDNKVVAYDSTNRTVLATSDPFTFSTKARVVGKLSDPSVSDVSQTSAKVTTTPSEADPAISDNGEYEDFTLEVHNSAGEVFDGGTTGTLNAGDPVTFTLTSLTSNTEYSDNKVVAIRSDGTSVIATSKTFTFTTTKFSIDTLSNPEVINIKKDSATVKTTVSKSPTNAIFNDYYLEVLKSDETVLGESKTSTLSSDGPQEINLKNLSPKTTYTDNVVVAYSSSDDTELARSSKFNFTTSSRVVNKLSDPEVSGTSTDSAIVKTTPSEESGLLSNGSYQDFTLEVHDSGGTILGGGITSTLSEGDSPVSITLTNLASDTEYSNNEVVAYATDRTILATSSKFTFSTTKVTIDTLSNPEVTDITKNSATVKTSVSKSPTNSTVNDYILEVHDSSGAVLGNGKTGTLSSDGNQEISLTKLSSNTDYNDNEVVAYATDGTTELARSSKFSFTTSKTSIDSLTKPNVIDIEKTKATVQTNVIASTNEVLNDYILEVRDSGGNVLGGGTTGTLTSDGAKEINLINLSINTTYTKNTVVALTVDKGMTLATSPEFDFTTNAKVVGSLSNPQVSEITKNSATVKTTVDEAPTNGEFKDYFLEVRDNGGNSLGKTSTLSDGGEQAISLTLLTPNKKYDKNVVVVIDSKDGTTVLITSSEFDFTTSPRSVDVLSNPIVSNITNVSATITTTVSEGSMNGEFIEYYLEVRDVTGAVLGKGSSSSDDGTQSINIETLTPNKKYEDNTVVAIDASDQTTEFATSIKFDFTTEKNSITTLSNATASDMEYDSATISVDTSIGNGGDVVKDYYVVITNTLTNETWESTKQTTSGNISVRIDNLKWDYQYKDGDITVSIKGTSITEDVPHFRTNGTPISLNAKTFNVDYGSITSNSFVFTIDINFKKEEFMDNFDATKLSLYSNDKKLNTSLMGYKKVDESTNQYKYKVSNLESQETYPNLQIMIEGWAKETSVSNIGITTIQKPSILIWKSVFVVFLFIIIITMTGFYLFYSRKLDKDIS